jgi:hypothetical protein
MALAGAVAGAVDKRVGGTMRGEMKSIMQDSAPHRSRDPLANQTFRTSLAFTVFLELSLNNRESKQALTEQAVANTFLHAA